MADKDGIMHDRRQPGYCAQHHDFKDLLQKTVPRWAFVTAMGSIMTVAIAFASWQITSMGAIREEISVQLVNIEKRLGAKADAIQEISEKNALTAIAVAEQKANLVKDLYLQDAEHFFKAAEENRDLLIESSRNIAKVRVDIAKIRAIQIMVTNQIGLGDHNERTQQSENKD